MKIYSFTITIDKYVDDLDVIDAFYAKADDASMAGAEGKTVIHFDREADSLDEALHRAITQLLREGWQVREIAVEPECVLPMSTP
jgi:hypothetical protein